MPRSALSFRPSRATWIGPRPSPGPRFGVPLRPNPAPSAEPHAALAELMLHPVTRPWDGNLMPDGEVRFVGNEVAWVARAAARAEEVAALEARPRGGKPYSKKAVTARVAEFGLAADQVYALRFYDVATDRATFEAADGQDEVTKSFGALRTLCQVLKSPWDLITVTMEGDVCFWTSNRVAAVLMAEPEGNDGALDEFLDGGDGDGGDDDDEPDVEPAPPPRRNHRYGQDLTEEDLRPQPNGTDDLSDSLWNEMAEAPSTGLDDIPGIFPDPGTAGTALIMVYGVGEYADDVSEREIDFEVVEIGGKLDLAVSSDLGAYRTLAEFHAALASEMSEATGQTVDPGEIGTSVDQVELDRVGRETQAAFREVEGLHGVVSISAGGFPPAVVARSTDRQVVAMALSSEEAMYLRDQGNAGRRDPRFAGAATGQGRVVDAAGTIDEARVVAHFPEGSVVVLDSGSFERPTFIGHFQVCGGRLWALPTLVDASAYVHYEVGQGETLVLPAEPVGWDAWRRNFHARYGFPAFVTAATLDPVFPARYGLPYRSAGAGLPPVRVPAPPPVGPAWPSTAAGLGGGGGPLGLPVDTRLEPPPGGAELARAHRGGPGPIARGPARVLRDLVTGEALNIPDGSPGLLVPQDMDHSAAAWFQMPQGPLHYTTVGGAGAQAVAVPTASVGELLLLFAAPAASGYAEVHAAVPIAAPPQLRLRDLTTGAEYVMPADAQLPAAPAQMDLSHPAWQGPDGWVRYTDLGGTQAAVALWPTPIVSAAWPLLAAVSGPDAREGYTLHAVTVIR